MKKNPTIKRLVLLPVLLFLAIIAICIVGIRNNGNEYRVKAEESITPIENVLTFTLFNDNTEYKVKAKDKTITDIVIPETYNGLPVTEISDNGFANCVSLVRVDLHRIKRIGTSAFANCRNLEVITGLLSVKAFGNNAFANCVKLNNVVLPSNITEVGSTLFRNNPNRIFSRMSEESMNALNSKWDSSRAVTGETFYIEENELVYTELFEEGVLIGYSISQGQNIYDYSDADFVISSTYNGKPVLEISEGAFAFCEFKTLTIKHTDENADHYINIRREAFNGLFADSINIEVDITLNDSDDINSDYADYEKGQSSNVFAASSINSIELPDSLVAIPRYTFSECANLSSIYSLNANIGDNHISSNVKTIGAYAFDGCISLPEIYLPNSIIGMGNGVFNQWGDNPKLSQTVHIDLIAPSAGCAEDCDGTCCDGCTEGCDGSCCCAWDMNWKGSVGDGVSFEFREQQITLDKNGGNSAVGSDFVYARYGQVMPAAVAPQKYGYVFKGYFTEVDGKGTKYYDQNMQGTTVWEKRKPVTLYAHWKNGVYDVSFDRQSGIGGIDKVEATFDEPMPSAEAPTRTGYDFGGYFTEPNGLGDKYYNADMTSARDWDIAENTTLYAHWIGIYSVITFDKQGGIGGTNEAIVQFGFVLPSDLIAPTKRGCVFMGYGTEPNGGDIYFDENMSSDKVWDTREQAVTLYARWEIIKYKITYNTKGWYGARAIDTSIFPDEYTVNDEIPLNSFGHEGYILEWSQSKIEKGSTGDVSVYVIASVFLSEFDLSYSAEICDVMHIYLSETPSDYLGLDVGRKVKALYLTGHQDVNYYMDIEIMSDVYNFELTMSNVKMYAEKGKDAIKLGADKGLTLKALTNVVIVGGEGSYNERLGSGSIGCYGIYCGSLRITGDKIVSIKGGRGSDGVKALRTGYNGGSAVYASEIYLFNDVKAFFIGGRGGNAGINLHRDKILCGGYGGTPIAGPETGVKIYKRGGHCALIEGEKGENSQPFEPDFGVDPGTFEQIPPSKPVNPPVIYG